MAIYLVMACALGLLFAVSAGEKLPEDMKVPGIRLPFYRAGHYLAGKLHPGREKMRENKYETEKLANTVTVLFLGLGISLLAQGALLGGAALLQENGITRPQKGEGDKVLNLQAQIEGLEETEDLQVVVAERQYTYEEKQTFLEEAMELLDTVILGENESADEVRGQVVLPSQMLDGKVTVQWICQPDGILDEEGWISEDVPEEGELLQLKAMLSCEGEEAVHELALRLYPPVRSAQEQLIYSLKKQVKSAEEDTAEEERLTLPQEVEGRSVTWMEPDVSMVGTFLVITVLASACAYLGKEQEIKRADLKRKRQLIMDYPNLLFKMSMLLDAGLTMQNAFSRIAFEYRDRKEKQTRYAYEEMLAACNEMKSGISEAQAYENFGRRCGETQYVKLGTVLAGNLEKGAQGLTKLLQEEAAVALDERRQLARKLGEEAGTKLLLPMVLMLMIVLVILMLPAVLSF